MYTSDREEPWLPRSDSLKPKGCSPTLSNVPIQWVIVPPRLEVEIERLIAGQLADKWHEAISNGEPGQAVVMNVYSWLSKATLDAYVGELRTRLIIITDPNPASGRGLLSMTSALWKTPIINSQSRIRTCCAVPFPPGRRNILDKGLS